MSLSLFARIACAVTLAIVMLPSSASAADWPNILPDESLNGWTRIPISPVDAGDH